MHKIVSWHGDGTISGEPLGHAGQQRGQQVWHCGIMLRVRYVIVTLVCARLFAQDFSALEQTSREELTRTRVPGASIALIKGDRIVFAKGTGTANVETGEPVRPEMLFRLGSTTKMFTSAAVAMLAEEGKLRLDAPVGDLVPGLHPAVARVTAAQVMSHTAGLCDELRMEGPHDDAALGAGVRAWDEAMILT